MIIRGAVPNMATQDMNNSTENETQSSQLQQDIHPAVMTPLGPVGTRHEEVLRVESLVRGFKVYKWLFLGLSLDAWFCLAFKVVCFYW